MRIECVDNWASPLSGITRTFIAAKHTLYPYWVITYPPNFRTEADNVINDGNPSIEVERSSVIKTRRSWAKCLKYCPLCVAEDNSTYGETYWRRQHQLSEMFYCTKHHIRLVDSDVLVGRATTGFYSASSVASAEYDTNTPDDLAPSKNKLLEIGKEVEWLINHGIDIDWAANGYKKYILLLRDKGLASLQGRCDYPAIESAFNDYWGKDFLDKLFDATDDTRFKGWAYQVDRNKMRAYKPLYHILLMGFLAGSVREFVESNPAETPFGHPPFVCENAVCPNYHVGGAEMIYLKYYMSGVTATFECAHCGMRYKHNKPKNLREHRTIAVYGHLWESELIRCCQNPNISNEQAAKILGCTENALALQKKKRGLLEPILYDKEMGPEKYYKSRVLELCEEYGEVTRSMLEKYVPGAYSHLGDQHKDWLRSHMVYESERKHRREYEEQLLERIQEFINQLATDGYPKRQVTFGYIASIIGTTRDAIRCRRVTHDLLKNVVESREAWLRRQIITVYLKRPPSAAPFSLADIKRNLTIHDATYTKHRKLIEQIIDELNTTN
jgi:hypothetical protein